MPAPEARGFSGQGVPGLAGALWALTCAWYCRQRQTSSPQRCCNEGVLCSSGQPDLSAWRGSRTDHRAVALGASPGLEAPAWLSQEQTSLASFVHRVTSFVDEEDAGARVYLVWLPMFAHAPLNVVPVCAV